MKSYALHCFIFITLFRSRQRGTKWVILLLNPTTATFSSTTTFSDFLSDLHAVTTKSPTVRNCDSSSQRLIFGILTAVCYNQKVSELVIGPDFRHLLSLLNVFRNYSPCKSNEHSQYCDWQCHISTNFSTDGGCSHLFIWRPFCFNFYC